MSKYVDVEALVVTYRGHTPDDACSKGVDFVLDLLDSKPPADVRPVVHGHWTVRKSVISGEDYIACSECLQEGRARDRFCSCCGAEMGGDAE